MPDIQYLAGAGSQYQANGDACAIPSLVFTGKIFGVALTYYDIELYE